MRKIILSLLLLAPLSLLQSQQATYNANHSLIDHEAGLQFQSLQGAVPNVSNGICHSGPVTLQLGGAISNVSNGYTPHAGLQLMGVGCSGGDLIGSATNMFTIQVTEVNCVSVDNDINTILFVHRNNAAGFGGSSGNFRYDISTNGGVSWTSNLGLLNPLMTFPGRHPQVSIYNPPANTDPNNAYLVYQGPIVNGTLWAGVVSGVRKLDGTGNTENYNQAGATQTLIPRGQCKGAPGEYWAVDYIYTGTTYTGYRVFKGVWNGSNDVIWSVSLDIIPAFNTAYNGSPQVADLNIAFDPTGQIGYVCALTHLTPGPANYAFYPVFWKTTDGGASWSGPEQVDLTTFPCITVGVPTAAFDVDLSVDQLGNPHALMAIGNGNNAYAIFYGQWHHMFDVTKEYGLWNVVDLATVNCGRGTFGTAPNQMAMDMEPQVSRTDDGKKIFFFWSGSDAVPLGTANQTPNYYGKAYDVINKEWTAVKDFSTCNPTTTGKIYFPKASPNSLNIGADYEIPIVYGEFTVGTDPATISNFRCLDSAFYTNADFLTSNCVASLNIDQGAVDTLCPGDSITVTGFYEEIVWSDSTTGTNYTVPTGSGMYYVVARQGCCIGIDSILIDFNQFPVADWSYLANNLSLTFTDLSTGTISSYLWDFGDGNNSTQQNPSHYYSMPGTYTVCLTVTGPCGVDSMCDTINVTCPLPGANFTASSNNLDASFTDISTGNPYSWYWDFGDGNISNLQNPTHSYTFPGVYTVCLTITDTCGIDTLCIQDTITCPVPVAAFNVNSSNLVQNFVNQSLGTPNSYFWTFGDGGTSTQQNPTHTYALPGTYNVCLTIVDTCGSDTICQQIIVSCPAPQPAFSFFVNGSTVTFTDGTIPTPTTYAWIFGDGGTSSQANPNHTYTSTGVYNVCLIVTNLCGSDTLCQNVTVTVIGTENGFTHYFRLYPNPSDGIFILENLGETLGDAKITLSNALGQNLAQESDFLNSDFRKEFDLSALPEGIYLLEVNGELVRETWRLVKR